MKIVRIIFRLMGENLNSINQQQGDRTTSNSTCIDMKFQHAIQTSINNYLSIECQETGHQHYIMWSNNNDIVVGYNWYSRKMLVVETLLTLKLVSDVITERIGIKSAEKYVLFLIMNYIEYFFSVEYVYGTFILFIVLFRSREQVKLEKCMAKVMNFSVVFFTRQYMTNNKNGPGSGCFSHSTDLKPDQILLPLCESGLIIGGDFIKYARSGNEDLTYPSFCKQLPDVIHNNPCIKQAFDVSTIYTMIIIT